MKSSRSIFFFMVFVSALFWGGHVLAYPVPPLTGPVIDQAGMMNPADIARVEEAIRRSYEAGQIQLQVVTIPSLQDEPIEEVSYQMVKTWKLGESKTDKGVLLLVSQADRKMRIEVGQGLEGAIPDIYAKQIVSDVMIPYFKEGRVSDGIVAGVANILQLAANESGGLPEPRKRQVRQRSVGSWMHIIIFVLFLLFTMMRPRRRGFGSGLILGGLGGGGFGGGFGGGGFGGGGGSWGGGGGGFSGGGSSGSW